MTTSSKELFSNLAIPPGETLDEELDYRDMRPRELAAMLQLSDEVMVGLFTGEHPITPKIAAGLEEVLGISAQIWLNLEAHYRETLARIAANQPDQTASADHPTKVDIAAD